MSGIISRRKALSLLKFPASFALAASLPLVCNTGATAQTPGMERRDDRRDGRQDRRDDRRDNRDDRRDARRSKKKKKAAPKT